MPFQFILPDIGEGVVEGEVVRWHVKTGDQVKEDQTLVEVMTDKATVQIPSPKAGVVGKLHYKEGEVAKVGKALLDIEETGAPAAAKPVEAKPAAAAAPAPRAEAPRAVANDSDDSDEPLVASTGEREVLATPLVRKLAREEGVELAKITGTGPNGRITREDVLQFAQGGQVVSLQQRRQEVVAPAQPAQWKQTRESQSRDYEREQRDFASQAGQPPARQPQQAQPQQQRPAAQQQQPQQPAARAPQQQPPAPQPQQPPRQQQPQQPAPQQQRPPQQQPAARATQGETRVPIRGLRKRISERMHLSKSTAAHFTYVEEFDLTDLVEMRDKLKARYADQGIKLNYLPFIMKATVLALKKFPNINSNIDDNAHELIVKHDYNIGIAVQTDDGLVVPVVKDVASKSIAVLAKEIEELSEKSRKRTASQADLTGGTFTITSLGQLGGVLATPVINYPEVAILGVHAIKAKPAVVDGQIVIRQLANFAASFDHRLIDGYIGAQFIAEIKRYLEDPQRLFMELA